MCIQNWISFSIQRWQSQWMWHEYLMRSPSVKILPCSRNATLGQDPPWIWPPCDKSILPFWVCNKGRIIISHVKPLTRRTGLYNIKSPKHHNPGSFSSDKLITKSLLNMLVYLRTENNKWSLRNKQYPYLCSSNTSNTFWEDKETA